MAVDARLAGSREGDDPQQEQAQGAHQFAHRRHQLPGKAVRQHGAEHAHGGAQATRGDAHLMHVFGIVAARRAGVVELQVRQAVQRDQAECRERRVLQLRFGLEDGRARTLEEVGKEFNVTRERIRQIEAKALRKLRHPSRSRKLKDYLE